MSTHNVWWQGEEARKTDGSSVKVNICTWDYEQKRGTAMLPGGQFAVVAQVTSLTIVEQPKERQPQ